MVSEGYQAIERRVVEKTPAESGWAEVVPFDVGAGMRRQGQGSRMQVRSRVREVGGW